MSNTQFKNFSDAVSMSVSANSAVDSIAEVTQSLGQIQAGGEIDKDKLEKLLNDIVDLFSKAAKEIKTQSGNLIKDIGDGLGQAALASGEAANEELEKVYEKMDKRKENINAWFGAFTGFSGGPKGISDGLSTFSSKVFGGAGDQLNSISSVVTAFGGDGAGVSRIMNGVNDTAKGVSQMFQGIADKNPFAILGGAAKAFMGILGVIGKDDRLEKKIQALKREVKELSREYGTMERETNRLFGQDKAKNMDKQLANLQKQKELTQQQLDLENQKKKTDKAKVAEMKDQLDKLQGQIETLEDSQISAVIGKDWKNVVSDFATAYANAWTAGNDKAAALKNVVKNSIQAAATELIKSNISGKVKEFTEALAKAMEDGVLSTGEEAMLDRLQQEILEKSKIDDSFNKYFEPAQATRTAASKGITSMTQDTAEELNGRFTAIQEHTASIKGSVQTLVNNGGEMLKTLFGIEQNTSRLAAIENNIVALRNGIDYINMKGVRLI